MSKLINTTLDDIFKSTQLGTLDRAIGNVFYGIDHRQQPGPVPINKDYYGLTFFTRPQLNLNSGNIRSHRKFIPLLNTKAESIQRIIRCYLDPRLNNDTSSVKSPFVDPMCAFIPLLTNHLLSCSGWPDIAIDTYQSKPGAYKEVFTQVDSTADIYSSYDITANFRNMVSDPITSLFHTWTLYQSLVFQGILVPYPDFIIKNEIDYQTRIYRLVLDSNKKYVQKIGCTGAAYPYSIPMGAAFNFESEEPVNQTNKDITINFKCVGACYQDDIIIHEFNTVVEIFNPSMRKRSDLIKVDSSFLHLFNFKGYPRIDTKGYELEWYVFSSDYENVTDNYKRHSSSINLTV